MSNKFKLGHLKPKNTCTHVLAGVHVPPNNPNPVRLELVSSGRINTAYTDAMMKLARDRELEKGAQTSNDLDASDARQLKLFAKHCIVGWGDVCDEQMQPMPFAARDVEDLLLTIAIEQSRPDLVAPAIVRASHQDNFSSAAEALGKS
jgi:hypothetical protein